MILSNFENFIFYWSEKFMKTLEDLANELNREEWAVERMLKNRGYLKNNGEPRKSTIDAGYMNKNGLITNSGWNTFVEELGYKEHVKDKSNSEQSEPKNDYEDGFKFIKSEETEDDGFIKYENSDDWWEGEYKGWRIRAHKTIAEKGQLFKSAVVWSVLRDEIDEFEDKVEALFSQIREYRGWKITESEYSAKNRLVAKKEGYEDISVYLGEDIRSEIDEIEQIAKNTIFEDEYRGWKIETKITKRGARYSAEKEGAFSIVHGYSLDSIKELIDEEEINITETQNVLANPENFSEEYKGWTITANGNELIAKKEGEDDISGMKTLDAIGLYLCRHRLHEHIDNHYVRKSSNPVENVAEDLHYDFFKNEWV